MPSVTRYICITSRNTWFTASVYRYVLYIPEVVEVVRRNRHFGWSRSFASAVWPPVVSGVWGNRHSLWFSRALHPTVKTTAITKWNYIDTTKDCLRHFCKWWTSPSRIAVPFGNPLCMTEFEQSSGSWAPLLSSELRSRECSTAARVQGISGTDRTQPPHAKSDRCCSERGDVNVKHTEVHTYRCFSLTSSSDMWGWFSPWAINSKCLARYNSLREVLTCQLANEYNAKKVWNENIIVKLTDNMQYT